MGNACEGVERKALCFDIAGIARSRKRLFCEDDGLFDTALTAPKARQLRKQLGFQIRGADGSYEVDSSRELTLTCIECPETPEEEGALEAASHDETGVDRRHHVGVEQLEPTQLYVQRLGANAVKGESQQGTENVLCARFRERPTQPGFECGSHVVSFEIEPRRFGTTRSVRACPPPIA
jgi:hypothetical protein